MGQAVQNLVLGSAGRLGCFSLKAGLHVQSSPTHGNQFVNNSEKDCGGPHLDTGAQLLFLVEVTVSCI